MKTRRVAAVLVGVPLLLVTAAVTDWINFNFFLDHYVIPKYKYGVLTALRWQDIAFIILFWCVALAFLYCSYRLLRFSLRSRPQGSTDFSS